MSFDSTRMRENPGEVFDVVFRDGSTGKACWVPIAAPQDRNIWTGNSWRYSNGHSENTAAGYAEYKTDIVAYAPRTEERWMIINEDGTFGERAHREKPPSEAGHVERVRIVSIRGEEAA